MASVKLLVKKHNVSKRDGKTPIYVQYNYSRDKRILINSQRRIELKYWDFEKDDIKITQKRGSERIDKTYKKFELVASHTCRRSFCTNEYLKGTPTLFIMKISGHRTERNFL